MEIRTENKIDIFKMVTTRTGDAGITSLYSGERRSKDDITFDCLGDTDELSSYIGVVRSLIKESFKEDLHQIQKRLLCFSAQVAIKSDSPNLMKTVDLISSSDVEWVEGKQKDMIEFVEIQPIFVCSGDNTLSAHVDVSRTICRRVERTLSRFIKTPEDTDGEPVYRYDLANCQAYINRLSDYLFLLARYVEQNEE